MSATKLEILSRHREHPGVIASLADFEWTVGAEMAADKLFDDPRYSLYCLDPDHELAIFTAMPSGVDLSQTPFMYQAQFDHAEYLVSLPFLDFAGLVESMDHERDSVLFLHNIGRCGSTVLSRALNEVDGVVSLSEPDALTAFIGMRSMPRAEQRDLLRACVAWLLRPAIVGDTEQVVIKFRNQAMAVLDCYVTGLPHAKHLFVYRNVIDWLASFQRLRVNRGDRPTRYSRAQIIEQQAAYYQCEAEIFAELAPPQISSWLSLEGRALSWLYMLGIYLELRDTGWPVRALRYEDLQRNRDATLIEVLRMMGLPSSGLAATKRAFRTDAQAGTVFARDEGRGNTVALPAEMEATVRRILSEQPVIQSDDFVLPGTIAVD